MTNKKCRSLTELSDQKIRRILVFWFFLLILSCQTLQKTPEEKMFNLVQQYQHLHQYKNLKCEIEVSLAEPVKSQWYAYFQQKPQLDHQVTKFQLFSSLKQMIFIWEATPYRCHLLPWEASPLGGSQNQVGDELVQDVEKKLNTIFCIWMQSFYADSPLRGWTKGTGRLEMTDKSLRLYKGPYRWMDFFADRKVVARMGEKAILSAEYERFQNGQLYPQLISYQNGEQISQLANLNYEMIKGKPLPKNFLFKMGRPEEPFLTPLYMTVDARRCEWSR